MMLVASSLTRATCAVVATSARLYHTRLVTNPPDLVRWVRREGGFVHQAVKVSFLDADGDKGNRLGLGLVASEDIPKGSELISLPKHVPLRFDEESNALSDLARYVPEELWALKLGLKLLQERAKTGSFWWPYISNLPESYTVPIFFPGEDIKNLQYAPLLHQVNKRCHFLLEFEKLANKQLENMKLPNHPFGGQEVDASALGWAMSAVSSRAFRLYNGKSRDGTHITAPMLLPLIDMCNHSFSPNSEIVQEKDSNDDSAIVKVTAREEIKQHDALELNYGCLNNDLFLLDYGFVIPSNPYDCIELKYDPALLETASTVAGVSSSPNFSSPSPWQQDILRQLNLHGKNCDVKVRIGGSELVEDRLLAALRVLLCNEREKAENKDVNVLKSISSEAPLGISNEVNALRTVVALCVIALGHFPTKIMEDEALLKQSVPVTTELAIKYRMQKKSVIVDATKDLTKRIRLLSSKDQSVEAL